VHIKLGFMKPMRCLEKDHRTGGSGRPNPRGAAARFLKPPFSVLLPLRKQAKPCQRILSTIDTTPSCCRSHLPLHHISLNREGGVVGALYVCISRRRRHLRRWIGSDREEETASTTTCIIHVLLNVSTVRFLQGYEDLIYLSH
jgi:hypothetical protein